MHLKRMMIKDELFGGNSLLLRWIAFSYYLLLLCSLSSSDLMHIFSDVLTASLLC